MGMTARAVRFAGLQLCLFKGTGWFSLERTHVKPTHIAKQTISQFVWVVDARHSTNSRFRFLQQALSWPLIRMKLHISPA